MQQKITVPKIIAQKGQQKIKMVTAYDTPSAQIADKAGADIILVGDSLMTAVLGDPTTLTATIEIMTHHTKSVAKTELHSFIVADMPWLSYHISVDDTIRNASKLILAGAQAVKLEGGCKRIGMIKALLDAEIPVMGHLGLTPQSYNAMGGYHIQGKSDKIANEIIEDAKALEKTGIFSLVLEGIPAELAKIITKTIKIPTIGIGAGPHCDGQVLVFNDVLGLNFGHVPKFVRPYADLSKTAITALSKFFSDIESGSFPSDKESYHFNKEELKKLKNKTK